MSVVLVLTCALAACGQPPAGVRANSQASGKKDRVKAAAAAAAGASVSSHSPQPLGGLSDMNNFNLDFTASTLDQGATPNHPSTRGKVPGRQSKPRPRLTASPTPPPASGPTVATPPATPPTGPPTTAAPPTTTAPTTTAPATTTIPPTTAPPTSPPPAAAPN